MKELKIELNTPFDLETFANKLTYLINSDLNYIDDSLVLLLTASFGYGKSTFLDLWRPDGFRVVRLNAWEHDYCPDPLIPIISALNDVINKEDDKNKYKDFKEKLPGIMSSVGNQVINKFTGIDAKKTLSQPENSLFSEYNNQVSALKQLKEMLSDLNNNEGKTLFLIDELDRCRPDYAISYLETIKHIFSIENSVFVLAVDKLHLENSARHVFGQDLDFDEYLRKFVHREVKLPSITDDGYKKLVQLYIDRYFGDRKIYPTIDHTREEEIVDLISGLKLSPRQIQEIFRLLGHNWTKSDDVKNTLKWCYTVGFVIMAIIKIRRPELFEKIGQGTSTSKDVLDFLKSSNSKHIEWFYLLIASGGGVNYSIKRHEVTQEFLKKEFSKNGIEFTDDDWRGNTLGKDFEDLLGYRNWGDVHSSETPPIRSYIYIRLNSIDNYLQGN